MAWPSWRRIASALWTSDRKTRIRLQHWSLSVVIYLACAAVMGVFVRDGEVPAGHLVAWLCGLAACQGVIHGLIRTGWSRRLADPSLSQTQIVTGILLANAGYAISRDLRAPMLLPLPILLTFGAFALPPRRMVELTLLCLMALACTMLGMHALDPARYAGPQDLLSFLLCAVLLPANTALSVFMGRLRERLTQQRSDLQAALGRIQDLATRDELTALANRRHAQALMEAEALRGARSGQVFSVALIDLDHFKRLNDAYGHAAGDAMLRAFAQEAVACARGADVVARWGGEEFIVLMPDTTESSAAAATERLRLQVERLTASAAEATFGVTCSAGVAEHQPGQTVAQTLLQADRALYRAKAAGRNRVVSASRERGPALHEAASARLADEPADQAAAP